MSRCPILWCGPLSFRAPHGHVMSRCPILRCGPLSTGASAKSCPTLWCGPLSTGASYGHVMSRCPILWCGPHWQVLRTVMSCHVISCHKVHYNNVVLSPQVHRTVMPCQYCPNYPWLIYTDCGNCQILYLSSRILVLECYSMKSEAVNNGKWAQFQ